MTEHGHQRSDRRNLHLHRAALAKLRQQPALRGPCLELLSRWLLAPEQRPSWPYLTRGRGEPVGGAMNRAQLEHAIRAAGLAISKLAAGRPKDLEFVRALLREGLVAQRTLGERLAGLVGLAPDRAGRLAALVEGLAPQRAS